MKAELIKHHEQELERATSAHDSWLKVSDEDQDKHKHVEATQKLVDFHSRALEWLRAH
jgi:hypothetical protein